MLRRMRNIFRQLQIESDFVKYEKECRELHEAEANVEFTDCFILIKLSDVDDLIQEQATSQFGDDIATKRTAVEYIHSDMSPMIKKLAFFKRNYEEELRALYDEKANLYDEKGPVHDELEEARSRREDARERFHEAKDDVDDWYSKSRGSFFGNAGEKIPKHAFFGQSFGDLESYKDDRDMAYRDLQDCYDEVGVLQERLSYFYNQIECTKTEIERVKADRSHMKGLKKAGHSLNKLEVDARLLSGRLADARDALLTAESQYSTYVVKEEVRLGVQALKDELKELELSKEVFLDEFDQPCNIEHRISEHRQEWLRERGLTDWR